MLEIFARGKRECSIGLSWQIIQSIRRRAIQDLIIHGSSAVGVAGAEDVDDGFADALIHFIRGPAELDRAIIIYDDNSGLLLSNREAGPRYQPCNHRLGVLLLGVIMRHYWDQNRIGAGRNGDRRR